MESSTFQADVLPVLQDCGKQLEKASGLLKSNQAIVLIESEGLFSNLLYAFHKLIRKLPSNNGIDVILHSLGGSIDAASGIASLCRNRFGSFRVIVPFVAKSAATLLALTADERLLASSAQLGPVDPQIRHPEKRMFFPAHSIKEALEQVQATKDPFVKVSMADKLDPFLLGAYQDAMLAAKQYIEEVVQKWPTAKDSTDAVATFTEKYKSHGYPIDRSVLKAIGAPYTDLAEDAEAIICELHEKCVDILEKYEAEDEESGTIMLTKDEYLFRLGEFQSSGKLAQPTTSSTSTPPEQPPQAAARANA